ncbi:hypothetical protein PTT_15475 [Pyrenophora teres f. teres 0-1]|uniref:Uncharacterized protein n=1 Tax=Pyrenophora teres f. teres (strain 0-1) TaxID=861557 RepID=E3S0A7_PYRTT|nr:hypothetical protein PTT_15475 [Pyrenophora teres f. teres 0-1]
MREDTSQSPNLEPRQLKPSVAPYMYPQRAFVDSLPVDVGLGAADVGDGLIEVGRMDDVVCPLAQPPKFALHPTPQYAEVEPLRHYPYEEQQLPKLEPWQVSPLLPPHVPSYETTPFGP